MKYMATLKTAYTVKNDDVNFDGDVEVYRGLEELKQSVWFEENLGLSDFHDLIFISVEWCE